MPRLIDADALLKDIGEEPMNWTDTQAEVQEYVDWKRTVATINSAQTIEAEPVRHGHWELADEQEPMRYGCAKCKRMSWYRSNYCPNCGAKMDEVTP